MHRAAQAVQRPRTAGRIGDEVVLRLGGPWASRVLNTWMESLAEADDVLVDPFGVWADPGCPAVRVARLLMADWGRCRGAVADGH